jgi:hypothetical protein
LTAAVIAVALAQHACSHAPTAVLPPEPPSVVAHEPTILQEPPPPPPAPASPKRTPPRKRPAPAAAPAKPAPLPAAGPSSATAESPSAPRDGSAAAAQSPTVEEPLPESVALLAPADDLSSVVPVPPVVPDPEVTRELAALPAPAATGAPAGTETAGDSAVASVRPVAPDQVIGLTEGETATLLGMPASREDRPPAKVWRYAGLSCELKVIFYPDVVSLTYRALNVDLGTADEACLAEVAQRRKPRA